MEVNAWGALQKMSFFGTKSPRVSRAKRNVCTLGANIFFFATSGRTTLYITLGSVRLGLPVAWARCCCYSCRLIRAALPPLGRVAALSSVFCPQRRCSARAACTCMRRPTCTRRLRAAQRRMHVLEPPGAARGCLCFSLCTMGAKKNLRFHWCVRACLARLPLFVAA